MVEFRTREVDPFAQEKKEARLKRKLETFQKQFAREKDTVDRPAVRELILFEENDQALQNQQGDPIIKNLIKKKEKGTYNTLAATILYKYYADTIAAKYSKEFGGTFSPATRRAIAVELTTAFESGYNAGDYRRAEVSKLVRQSSSGEISTRKAAARIVKLTNDQPIRETSSITCPNCKQKISPSYRDCPFCAAKLKE